MPSTPETVALSRQVYVTLIELLATHNFTLMEALAATAAAYHAGCAALVEIHIPEADRPKARAKLREAEIKFAKYAYGGANEQEAQ